MNIVYKLPKDVELSQYLRDKALAYVVIMVGGIDYYVPITKQMKREFAIIERKGKLIFTKSEIRVEDILREIIDAIYLQVRDVVCAGIEESLDQKLKEGFSTLFEKFLHKKVEQEMTKRLPDLREKK